jgi:hypothetical protein
MVSRRSERNRYRWLRPANLTREVQAEPAMPLASPVEMPVFVRVNQVLVRLWACLLAVPGSSLGQSLTGCAVPYGAASSEQDDRSEATVVC